jgi:hypothetical protein
MVQRGFFAFTLPQTLHLVAFGKVTFSSDCLFSCLVTPGQISSKWVIGSEQPVLSFSDCDRFCIPESVTNGYHDLCFPRQDPSIWHFVKGKYRPLKVTSQGQSNRH